MGLREDAALDLIDILEDVDDGFGWPITVTDPDGRSLEMQGLSTDIGQLIDPETGIPVAGRQASVALSLRRLQEAGLGLPQHIADVRRRPWLVRFDDIEGRPGTFAVSGRCRMPRSVL